MGETNVSSIKSRYSTQKLWSCPPQFPCRSVVAHPTDTWKVMCSTPLERTQNFFVSTNRIESTSLLFHFIQVAISLMIYSFLLHLWRKTTDLRNRLIHVYCCYCRCCCRCCCCIATSFMIKHHASTSGRNFY